MKFSRKLSILTKKKIVEFYKSGLKGEKQIRQEYGVTPLLLAKLVRWYNRYFLNPQKNYYQTVKSRTMAKPKKTRKISDNAREKALEKELKLLKQKNQKLEKALKWEELKSQIYETTVILLKKNLTFLSEKCLAPNSPKSETGYPCSSVQEMCDLFGKTRQAWYKTRKAQETREMQEIIILGAVKHIRKPLPHCGLRKLNFDLQNKTILFASRGILDIQRK